MGRSGRLNWWLLLQVAVVAVVVVLVGRALRHNWTELSNASFSFSVQPAWLALSLLLVGATYLVLIESWRRILVGWGQPLRYRAATRIWFLANLGRYVPGKVWSVAGMVVLAQREGVEPWAATASAIAVQAIGIGTAVAVTAAAMPGAESPLRLALAAALAVGTIALLAWEIRHQQDPAPDAALRRVPRHAVAVLCVRTGADPRGLGALRRIFWALARGLGLPVLSLPAAIGIFALGYILGLLALFAPGGAGVREFTFTALLTPLVGAGPASASAWPHAWC